jgi:hypothetical protein
MRRIPFLRWIKYARNVRYYSSPLARCRKPGFRGIGPRSNGGGRSHLLDSSLNVIQAYGKPPSWPETRDNQQCAVALQRIWRR